MAIRALLVFLAMSASTQSLACTFCHSRIAQDVRARLFDSDFLANLSMVSLPALVLFGAVLYAARTAPTDGSSR